jgi:hypothetical protein
MCSAIPVDTIGMVAHTRVHWTQKCGGHFEHFF